MSRLNTVALAVSTQRVFVFPADLARTAAHFCDFTRILGYLPYLRQIKTHAANQYRIVYSAAEGGIYHVTFTCDVSTHYDSAGQTFCVAPVAGIPTRPTGDDVELDHGAGLLHQPIGFPVSGA